MGGWCWRLRDAVTLMLPFLIVISLITPLQFTVYASQQDSPITYTYDCRDGVVYAVINAYAPQGSTNMTFSEDPGTVEDSITAIDQNGTPLPVIAGGGEVTVFLSNTSTRVQLSYVIIPSQVSSMYMIEIHPTGPATVILPVNGSLVYASDSPSIYANYTRITLVYKSPGVYTVYYNVPLQEEISGTATTQPGQTTTSTSGTQASVTQSQTQSTTPSTSTSSTQTTTGSLPITSTTQISGTGRTSSTTAKTTPKERDNTLLYTILAVVLVIIGIAYYLYKNKTSGQSGTVEPSLVDSQLDDRDLLLLKLISRGGHNISSLARESGLSKSVVWRRIRKLEELGLIETSKGLGKVDITLTDKGRNVLGES
jgi:uncharacterized membrane protein